MPANLTIRVNGLAEAADRLRGLNRNAIGEILDHVGAIVAAQTKIRIREEKTSPDGLNWAPWSPRYAATRRANHALLENEGHLHDSITHNVIGDEVEIGSNRVYAGVHQYGYSDIPARPYLGVSTANERDIIPVVEELIDTMLGGLS